MTHDIDDLQLFDQVIDEELDCLNPKVFLQHLDVVVLIDQFHEVLGPFLVVDAVDAGLRKALRELLEDVIAGLHDLGARERFDLQEGVS